MSRAPSNRYRLLSPAKLNLMLHITGRRPDGYHLLQTVFQLLDYGDTLDFDRRGDNTITLAPDVAGVAPADNLIMRAARLLQQTAQRTPGPHRDTPLGADIHIDKILPMGAGIGGGSSNAATTLLALNKLWNLRLTIAQLAELGVQLGADVPVFVRGRSAWAEGIGEQLQAIEIPDTWYFVASPRCEVASGEIFCHKQLTRNTSPITIAAFFERGGGNDCEAVARSLYPQVDAAFQWLNHYAPARLTGTGACVFASLPDRQSAQRILRELPADMQGFVARGVNISPTHRALGL